MRVYLLICFIIILVDVNIGDYDVIDLSDILNVDYMPGSLLVLENAEEQKEYKNDHRGTFDTAFTTMGYHRKMMNEYLCRSYVSEQIISEMKSTRIRRRLGNPAESAVNVGSLSSKINFSIKNNLLEDEGSSNYKDWLKKSTTLEDIYRHYDSAQNREAPESSRDADEEANEEYDGHVTGYGYQQPHGANSPSKLGHSGTGGGYSYHGYPSGVHSSGNGAGGGLYGGSSGYGTGGSYLGGHSDHLMFGGGSGGHGYGVGLEHSPKHHGSHDGKDKLADLFDIALTALAYLSFGMFIIQVIMCISMANTTTAPAMTMMPMSMSPTGVEPTGGMITGDGMMGGGGINGGGTSNGGNTDGGGTTDEGNGGTGGESTTEGNVGEGPTGGGTIGDIEGGTTSGDANGNADGDEVTVTDGGDGNTTGGIITDGGERITGDGNVESEYETTSGDGNGNDDDNTGDTSTEVVDEKNNTRGRTGVDDGNDETPTSGEGGTGGSTTGDGSGDNGEGGGGDDGVTDGGTTGGEDEGTIASGCTGTGGTGGTGGTDTGGTGTTGDGRDGMSYKRKRRDIPIITQPNNEALNELARRILISIEAALVANQDDGNCLRKTLCENNMYSRSLQSNQKYWIPVWSLGMSWLSGRLVENVPRATSMLGSLKASLLGLGKADCEILYCDCDLAKERQIRPRRRRKRTTY